MREIRLFVDHLVRCCLLTRGCIDINPRRSMIYAAGQLGRPLIQLRRVYMLHMLWAHSAVPVYVLVGTLRFGERDSLHLLR